MGQGQNHSFIRSTHIFNCLRTLSNILGNQYDGYNVRLTGIEGQMGAALQNLRLNQSGINGPVEMVGNPGDLTRRDLSTDCVQDAMSWRKIWT
jgi:hypothetical protein